MRIAQIAPPWFPVPPPGYGGIERVVFDLTEGLMAIGAEVVLFAPRGSKTSAELVETVAKPVGLNLSESQKRRYFIDSSREAFRQAEELGVDLIHDHTDYNPRGQLPIPVVHTVHGPATRPSIASYRAMSRKGHYFVAISANQQRRFEEGAERDFGSSDQIRFAGMVFNPVDVANAPFYPKSEKQGYGAFLGRCHWEKAPGVAIRVAQAAGIPLMMALRVTHDEEAYFEAVVRPAVLSIKNLAKFVGEVGGKEKDDLIGRASVVIFSSPWEEPFGLVIMEAAARGTPVVAYARGSAPELIVDGVTGFLCADEEEMIAAIPRAMELDPAACRAHAESLCDRKVVAQQYLDCFRQILAS